MLIAGLAGAALSCAETTGAARAQATMVATSIAVFILVFPSGLNESMVPSLAKIGSNDFARAPGNGSANELTADQQQTNAPAQCRLCEAV